MAYKSQSADRTVRHTLDTYHHLSEGHAQASVKILVTVDNVINRKAVVRMLKDLGFRVDLVTNDQEVLQALERPSYIAVLMDCRMPEMDGFSATTKLRRREALGYGQDAIGSALTSRLAPLISHHIPIIAMMTKDLREDRDRCLATGIDDSLSKPLQPKLLADVLARWMSASASISDSTNNRPLQTAPDGQPCDYPRGPVI